MASGLFWGICEARLCCKPAAAARLLPNHWNVPLLRLVFDTAALLNLFDLQSNSKISAASPLPIFIFRTTISGSLILNLFIGIRPNMRIVTRLIFKTYGQN
jgi:hypothetical protein